MIERPDAFHISVLPKVGFLTDISEQHRWVYLAITRRHHRPEVGLLYDIPGSPDQHGDQYPAKTRAGAVAYGREHFKKISETDDNYHHAKIVEDWAYTLGEAANMEFRTTFGIIPSDVDEGCGCGGSK